MMTEMATTERDPAEVPETTRAGRIYRPSTDIVERDGSVSLMLEMPGVTPDVVDITLENSSVMAKSSAAGSA